MLTTVSVVVTVDPADLNVSITPERQLLVSAADQAFTLIFDSVDDFAAWADRIRVVAG